MKFLLTLLTLVVLGTATTATAQAQTPESYDEDVLRQLISVQLERSLDSPLATIRSQTLKNAIVFTALYRDRVDLNGAVAKIAEVAREDDSQQNRRLAIAALRAIGTYRANRFVAELEGMQEDEYRTLVAGVLSEYYEFRRAGTL